MINNRFNVFVILKNNSYICGMEKTTDKNGRDIKVGDYVKVVNRITGSVEDSGVITKIEGRQVHLGVESVNGVSFDNIYLRGDVIKQY